MHPPWIIFRSFFILLVITYGTSRNVNVENSATEKDAIERERRLIPYMTYYVTQSLVNTNSQRQNTVVPILSPRGSPSSFDAIPQISVNNPNNQNSKLFPAGFSPVTAVPSPLYFATVSNPAGGRSHHQDLKRTKIPVPGHVLRLEPEALQQGLRPLPSLPPRFENDRQEIKIASTARKSLAPSVYKIIPVVRLPSGRLATITPPQPRHSYAAASNFPAGLPAHYAADDPQFQNLNRANEQYGGQTADDDRYSAARVGLPSTDYGAQEKFGSSDIRKSNAKNRPDLSERLALNLTAPELFRLPIKVNPALDSTTENQAAEVSSRPLIYYAQKTSDYQKDEVYSPIYRHFFPGEKAKPLPRLRVPQEEDIKFVAGVTPISVNNDLGNAPRTIKYDEDKQELHIYKQPTLDNFLSIIRETDNLPQNITPNNIDNGIKTLAYILERLQQQNYQDAKKTSDPAGSKTKAGGNSGKEDFQNPKKVHSFPQPSGTSTPGRPGVDYPTYSSIPPTKFDCSTQRYKGFFGDPDTKCQVWHYCDLNGGQASFLCPNGTIFSQVALTCDWWFNVKCATTSQLYVLNERLYKYILPFSPSFPEDYSGPVVDTYLAAKFKEMEAKSKSKALKPSTTTTFKPETKTKTSNPQ